MRVNVTRVRTPASLWNAALLAHKCCYQFQLSERTRSVRSHIDVDLAMHSIDAPTTRRFGTVAPIIETCFQFTPEQKANCGMQPRITDLVANKMARGEFFYGIEITGQQNGKTTCVDFNGFLPVLPTFISIVWLPHYFSVQPIKRVETLQMIRQLEPYIPAMPHVSIYRLTEERADEFLALNFTNLLAVRGDKVDEEQPYKRCQQLIEHARRVRGDSISITVAGHPEGYLSADRGPDDMAENIAHLKQKVDTGANFIITQICYSPEILLKYLRMARDAGVTVPIMVGVVVPESFEAYELIEMISRVRLPPEQRATVEQCKDDDAKVRNFFVQLALCIIQHVLDGDVGVLGIQFYTMNRYGSVQEVLSELRKRGILKEPPPADTCAKA